MVGGNLINSDTVTGILALVCVYLTFAVPITRMVVHLLSPAPKLPTEDDNRTRELAECDRAAVSDPFVHVQKVTHD